MGKNKLAKFEENKTFTHVIEPSLDTYLKKDHELKGKWHKEIFGNNNPLVLELGCGKGEYAVNLAKKHPEKNFLGIDIKGARIWKGAKISDQEQIKNVYFLRTRIEFLDHFFATNEVSEIWITFPDPQRKKRRRKKRMTHTSFLSMYQKIMKNEGKIHLKTDSMFLYRYTKKVLESNNLKILADTGNLYKSPIYKDELTIKTHYEALYLEGNPTITYLKFQLNKESHLAEPATEDEAFL
ncbi:MAG TPA: tRNA (guanosine(46)-N7)-methyltransferase TrmB [Salinivirga sp.]|uniref:tRNA (guanosine(46)-N7)-methyltransferase TrmB n=1 Tax=Salinivirga sp. TaxID=1970192 RepID=UPI002B46DE34|nr:tRNA (guanosine(46)-N7)-methyltransferase TrmB [Salinivirga sp.]HKK58006.1 tRNA (guanosine(46)-N7)-methyltransferase TrmB [Salinivirga sp.]